MAAMEDYFSCLFMKSGQPFAITVSSCSDFAQYFFTDSQVGYFVPKCFSDSASTVSPHECNSTAAVWNAAVHIALAITQTSTLGTTNLIITSPPRSFLK